MTSDGSMTTFRIEQIDHVEVFVPDRRQAAKWYEETLGLQVVAGYEHWSEDPRGPLMISCDGGATKIALFTGEPQGDRPTAGWHLLAFRVDAAGMRAFVRHAGSLGLRDSRNNPMAESSVVDHGKAFSIYFSDPWGHRLEVTTYDSEAVRRWLEERP